MIILGIDPGMATSGYGVIDCQNGNLKVVEMGWISTSNKESKDKRLISTFEQTLSLIRKHKPEIISIERLFFFINLKTAMVVAEFGGVIRLAAAIENVPLFEYAPLSIKMEVTGSGKADKKMMKEAVRKILHVRSPVHKKTYFDDVSDALAIAICHASRCQLVTFPRISPKKTVKKLKKIRRKKLH